MRGKIDVPIGGYACHLAPTWEMSFAVNIMACGSVAGMAAAPLCLLSLPKHCRRRFDQRYLHVQSTQDLHGYL
jgi:hypothetical protein